MKNELLDKDLPLPRTSQTHGGGYVHPNMVWNSESEVMLVGGSKPTQGVTNGTEGGFLVRASLVMMGYQLGMDYIDRFITNALLLDHRAVES